MSRDIKFRGYAAEEMVGSQWMHGTGIHVTEFTDEYAKETGKKEEHFVWTSSGWVEVEKDSIGQFTGLTDKNGVEIYEGDVIRYTKVFYTDCSREEIEEVSAPVIGSFYYAEDLHPGLEFEDGTGSLFWPGTIDSEEFEVIGNIYENPELLESST